MKLKFTFLLLLALFACQKPENPTPKSLLDSSVWIVSDSTVSYGSLYFTEDSIYEIVFLNPIESPITYQELDSLIKDSSFDKSPQVKSYVLSGNLIQWWFFGYRTVYTDKNILDHNSLRNLEDSSIYAYRVK